MKRRPLLAAGLLSAVAPLARAQAEAPPMFSPEDLQHAARLRDAGLADGEAWRLVQQLCTQVGARAAGSPGDAKAVAWAQQALRALKLQQVRADPIPLRVWQRGPASARLVAPEAHPLVMTALGNSVAAPEGGIEAELAVYPDFAALKADTSDKARGRIVFIDQKTERWRDGRGYGAAVPARSQGAVEAAKRGALALAIRSIGTDTERIAHTGAMRYELGQPQIPAFAVSAPDAERIAALHAGGATLRLQFSLAARSGVEAITHNVIAELPGAELPEEIVLLGAHLDSWDLGVGALDDGAGVAIVSAAAGLMQRLAEQTGRRPRRTVRVVLFANEENGFDGALDYSRRYQHQPHQLVSESDFGAGKVWRLRSRVQPEALPLLGAIAQVLAPLGVDWPEAGRNEGSPGPDAAMLMRRHRWPALQLAQDGTNYFDVHHTVHDTLDRIVPAELAQNVACWAASAWLVAQSPLRFTAPPA
jgi:carboxypeptidase Q